MIKGIIVAIAEGAAAGVGTVAGVVVGAAAGAVAGGCIGYSVCEKAVGDALRKKLNMNDEKVMEEEVVEPPPAPKGRARKPATA